MTAIIGVDGARGGWITARNTARGAWAPKLELFADFDAVIASAPEGAIIAVDMPMGLPDKTPDGGRPCEAAARAFLGRARSSSVFSTPGRRAIYADSYAVACALIREDLPHRKGLSKQAWMIVPRMREVDRAVRRRVGVVVREAHPETIFARMNAHAALADSKKTPSGEAQRIRLLEAAGLPVRKLAGARPRGCTRDDVLDALACLWTARRIALGKAQVLGEGRAYFGQRTGIWS